MARQKVLLSIEGMHCGHCVGAVRGALEQLRGVDVKEVSIGSAEVSYDPDAISRDEVTEALDEEGYHVVSFTPAA